MAKPVMLQLQQHKPGSNAKLIAVTDHNGLPTKVRVRGRVVLNIYSKLAPAQRKSLRHKGKCNINLMRLLDITREF
jgi:hypothetical protein